MARPKKDAEIDLSAPQDITAGLIERLACPPGKQQAFLRDAKAPGLRVRVTAAGAKSFVFEKKLDRQTIRRTIGNVKDWQIDDARTEARRLAVMLDSGTDPREVEKLRKAAKAAAAIEGMTVGEVWPRYLLEGKPKRKDAFKPRYLADLKVMSAAGGEKKKRGDGKTRAGPLFPLMAKPLASITEDVLTVWFADESAKGRHQAVRALMMFRGFLRWCSARPEYRALVDRDAGKAAAIVEAMPQVKKRTDCIEAAQLPGWFEGTSQLGNRTLAT